ncbi:NPCBM/NEW2 domain-containing protein [Micromonospora citrea]|uniref:NPCBM/NEW2 domain-containing protein n=1 Tax=Micromonospora citrea TaxID=47855 RepID=A0A1C6UFL6_9ACTN|nr:NPCBM/NEW2 domain-containing protein [Micromonospora citrea]SCL52754.1 NPCBM/NEW2 domain-containing protein [Micromonospora citrea]
MQRRRRTSHPAIVGAVIAAVATVAAAAIPVALELTRDKGGGTPVAQVTASTVPARPTGAATGSVPGAATGSGDVPASPPAEAAVRSLTEMPEVSDFEGWEQEPRVVAGVRRDTVLTTSPCWLNDKFTVTFVVSRQFKVLEATVGLADDSPKALPLRFTVLADRKAVFTTTVGLGKTRPVKVDIGDATQVSLQVGTTSLDQCHGDSIGVWIAPRVRR